MAKRRRIPPWVVILAFAVLTGAAIAGLAYLRAFRAESSARDGDRAR